jgi:hypothetical protein
MHGPALDSIVENPGNVGRSQNKHARVVMADAVHLHEKFGLDSTRTLGFAFSTAAGEGIELVNEDDGRFRLTRHLEKLLHEPDASR